MNAPVLRISCAPSARQENGAVQRLFSMFSLWRQRATERRRLTQLAPLALRDLGLSEADVWAEASKAPWRE